MGDVRVSLDYSDFEYLKANRDCVQEFNEDFMNSSKAIDSHTREIQEQELVRCLLKFMFGEGNKDNFSIRISR